MSISPYLICQWTGCQLMCGDTVHLGTSNQRQGENQAFTNQLENRGQGKKGLAVPKGLQKFLCYCHNMVQGDVPQLRITFFPLNLYEWMESPGGLAWDSHRAQREQPLAQSLLPATSCCQKCQERAKGNRKPPERSGAFMGIGNICNERKGDEKKRLKWQGNSIHSFAI